MKSLRAEIRMDQDPAPAELTQEVILYPGVKRIDFINRVQKASTLTKEEVYYAFPFDVKNSEINCELPGAVFRPGKDQLSGSFTGFSGIQHWADASNADFGVAVATREVPAIEFGEIRTNEWSMAYNPARSAFYFYVANNKENTNGAEWQGSDSWRLGFLELHFAVTSHAKGWREGNVTQFGWEHNSPLMARYVGVPQAGKLPAVKASFSESLPKNVILQSLKQAEDGNGYIARFYETEGKAATVVWSGLPGKIREAQVTSLTERPLSQVKIQAGKLTFSIGPWRLVTVRLIPEKN
jgi:alpha-mannosidase